MGKLKKIISQAIDMPVTSLGGCPYIALEGNYSIKLDECEEIISYDETKTVLRLSIFDVTVLGRGLTINSYGGGTVKLTGEITDISITNQK